MNNMKRIATSSLVLAVLVGSGCLTFSACSVETRGLGGETDDENQGEIGLKLSLPSGSQLNSVSYTVTGPSAFSKTGSVDLSKSTTLSVQLTLPAGGPYSITLTGTTTDGSTSCAGAGTFSVIARQTSKVNVHLTCHEAPRTGSALVTGVLNICPQIDGLAAAPAEVLVGKSTTLSATAHDSDAAPAALAYAWSASSGTLSSSSGSSPSFTCTAPGDASITLTVSDGDTAAGCAETQTTSITCTSNTATYALFGDWPYGTVINTAPSFIAQVNADPDVKLALHIGDIHSGSQACSDAYNLSIFNYFQQFNDPLVYTPGDNEWTDCQKTKEFSSGYPIDELTKLRALFFATPGKTLGVASKTVLSQGNAFDPAHPEDAAYVENVLWEEAGVLFVTLNIPGSNDDRLPWAAPFSNPTAQADEIAKRDAANSRWLSKAFALATAHGDAGLLLGQQADMWDPAQAAVGGDGLTGFDAHVAQLATLALAFGKPVLLVNGDSHLYEAEHPLADPTSAAYGYHPVPAPVPNLTRITVDGSTNFTDWVKLAIDPNTPDVFSWTRINTP
jgi:hypothetical protein